MNSEEKLKILRRDNPFTSSSAGNPWETRYPDVVSLNRSTFDGISQLIRQKTREPSHNCAGLVLGEVGSGKTHLIGRILDHGNKPRAPYAFAYIQPIEDADQTYRYLLREIIVNLCHPVGGTRPTSLFEQLLAKLYTEILAEKIKGKKKYITFQEKIRKNPASIFSSGLTPATLKGIERTAIERFRGECPKNFLKVIFQYRFKEKRATVVDWLKGAVIDAEDASMIHVPDRMNESASAMEQESCLILGSIGFLLARYRLPVVVCFDRLENLQTDSQIFSLGKMIEFLVDRGRGMLPVAFIRGEQWYDKFKLKLDQRVISRLETNKFILEGCSGEQAIEIIRNRLASVYGKNTRGTLYPFKKEELNTLFSGGLHSPRVVITLVNRQLGQIFEQKQEHKPASPLEKLHNEFMNQFRTILADFDHYQPDRGRLRRALGLYLSNSSGRGGFEVVSLTRSRNRFVDFDCELILEGSAERVPVIFLIDIAQHHLSVGASLKCGIDFLRNTKSGKAFYIRDKRCPFPSPPRWKATNEKLKQFKRLGGNTIGLGTRHAASWYSLALLNYAVKEGDITVIDGKTHMRPVAQDEFSTFLKEIVQGSGYRDFREFDKVLAGSSV